MKPFYDLNRLICRCLEVLNILMALPLGAFIYVVSESYLSDALIRHHGLQGLYNNEIVVDITAIILAVIGILYINGGIAQALDKRRFLEHISQSVEDLDRSEDTSAAAVTIIEARDTLTPKKKRKAKKKKVRAASTKTAQPLQKKAAKPVTKKAAGKTAAPKTARNTARKTTQKTAKKAAKKARS